MTPRSEHSQRTISFFYATVEPYSPVGTTNMLRGKVSSRNMHERQASTRPLGPSRNRETRNGLLEIYTLAHCDRVGTELPNQEPRRARLSTTNISGAGRAFSRHSEVSSVGFLLHGRRHRPIKAISVVDEATVQAWYPQSNPRSTGRGDGREM